MKSKLHEIDNCIRQGEREFATTLINEISTKHLTGREREEYCGLALRLGKADTVLRLLSGEFVRSYQTRQVFPAGLKACYAQALTQVGAVHQASRIFQELLTSREAISRLHLYAAVNLFAQWKYEEAASLLQEGLAHSPNHYETLVLKLNLISALLGINENQKAGHFIVELKGMLNPTEHKLLYWNLQELHAQENLYSGRFEEAKSLLESLASDPSIPSDRYKLFIEKWSLMRRILVRDSSLKLDSIKSFQMRAKDIEHWESVRESYLMEALFTGNRQLLSKVEVGTPWSAYKSRARKLFCSLHGPMGIAGNESLCFSEVEAVNFIEPILLNSRSGASTDGKVQLKPGSLIQKLLLTLTRDFFRPASVGNLFSELWPNEFYDPVHSPDRVYQLIARLRKTLKGTPGIEVIEIKGHYRIHAKNGYAIQVWQDREIDFEVHAFIETIQQLPIGHIFKSGELVHFLQKSQTTIVALLNRSVAQNRVEKLGAGVKTCYKLVA